MTHHPEIAPPAEIHQASEEDHAESRAHRRIAVLDVAAAIAIIIGLAVYAGVNVR
jgi:hypothetical protein